MLVIAECGLNWKNFEQAIAYCDIVKEIGADIIKYQIVENKDLPQLTFGEWKVIKTYCDKIGLEFLATPSSEKICNFLLYELKCNRVKIGSDHAKDYWLPVYLEKNLIISNGYHNILTGINTIMYCVSLYPCDPKYVDFEEMEKYNGFSDHTLRFDIEWCKKIKETGVEYYEKHISLYDNDIDKSSSLNKEQFEELIFNLNFV